jgi:hypothetical protein
MNCDPGASAFDHRNTCTAQPPAPALARATPDLRRDCGIDWIIVDLEHGPIDLGSAHAMITATSGTPCVPMVRIAANEP